MGDRVVAMSSRKRGRARVQGRRVSANAAGVLDSLRERIASQEIPPGAKLRENELAEEFGITRTRVREVLTALEGRGLIERIPHRGAVVSRLDLAQVSYVYDLREVLEGLCVRLATLNVPRESWNDLAELFGEPMERYVREGDFDAFLAGYERFRARTIEAAGNPLLAQMLDSIYEKTQVLIRRIIILPGRAEQGLKEHRAVIGAMCRGDAEEAEARRRENMRSAKSYLIRYQKYVL